MLGRKKQYSEGWTDYPGKERIYDRDIARFVKQHLRFIDRFNVRRISEATIDAFYMHIGINRIPETKDWKF